MRFTDVQIQLIESMMEWSKTDADGIEIYAFLTDMADRITDGNLLYSEIERMKLNSYRDEYSNHIDKSNTI